METDIDICTKFNCAYARYRTHKSQVIRCVNIYGGLISVSIGVLRDWGDLRLAGESKSFEMEEKISQKLLEMNTCADNVQIATKFTEALQCHPDVFKNTALSADQLINLEGGDHQYIHSTFLPAVMKEAGDQALPETGAHQQIPGRSILKQAFFQLKALEDHLATATSQHATMKKRYAKHKESLSTALAKKRAAAEMERKKLGLDDEVEREVKLARRNQLNRRKKNIAQEKIKKHRSEDNLPEALPGIDYIGICWDFFEGRMQVLSHRHGLNLSHVTDAKTNPMDIVTITCS